MVEITYALQIANALCNDPTRDRFGNLSLGDLARALNVRSLVREGDKCKYTFDDGTCIVSVGDVWGFGNEKCWCCLHPHYPDGEPMCRCEWHALGDDDDRPDR